MHAMTECSAGLYTGGQPTPGQLDALAAAGVGTVIDLRDSAEDRGFAEAAYVKSLGLSYVGIPVAGPGDLTHHKARDLAAALDAARQRGGGTAIHCASGNRVGAMLALVARWERGVPAADALALGRKAGMTTLQPAIAGLLRDDQDPG
jgi:protein tyrosine phosphatase (PTP) superfamily phosphohydrolase (DUF442 family)